VKWFFCLDDGPGQFALARVAVETARARTAFEPHCLYAGRDARVADWLAGRGVAVHSAAGPTPAVARALARAYGPRGLAPALAAYLRVDVPLWCDPADTWVLYTDTDVLFTGDWAGVAAVRPAELAMTADSDPLDRTRRNSGVVVMNAPALRADHPRLVAWLARHVGPWPEWDQEALRRYYVEPGRCDWLPLEYNWRPFWAADWAHFEGLGTPRTRPVELIHFQGLKPWDADPTFGGVRRRPHLQTPRFLHWAAEWAAAERQSRPSWTRAPSPPPP
jgi:hypothetical protein